MEWAPVYHIKGWGKFNRNYGDFCTGADTFAAFVAEKLLFEPSLVLKDTAHST